MKKSLLLVEDDITFSLMLKTWLQKKSYDVKSASNAARAKKDIAENHFDLILSDLRLPDEDGISILEWMQKNGFSIPVIIMTGYADIQSAVQAMKCGANDYISKPIHPDELLKKIEEAMKKPQQPTASSQQLPETSTQKPTRKQMSSEEYANNFLEGESEAARQLYNYVRLVAPTPMSVLINGASGTGKEYVAHRIHQLSKRADKPFIAIDCGSIPKDLAASEFFGHVKGAFTGALTDKTGAFEEANGGTLFLDEIGNLSYDVQVQLLRAIQERRIRPVGSNKEIEVDVRLVSATNENLKKAIADGKFREDLYHRINEFTLVMPALRERGEDILLFANFFLDQANKELGRDVIGFDAEAMALIQRYTWPGNLRQLKNVVKRATLLAQGKVIHASDLQIDLTETIESATSSTTTSLHTSLLHDGQQEQERIREALRQCNFNKSKAARLLGIDRKTLYNKLKLYKMDE